MLIGKGHQKQSQSGTTDHARTDHLRDVGCPVDVVFPEYGIRARTLPGRVDLVARTAEAPDFSLGAGLISEVEQTLTGDARHFTPLKIDMTSQPAKQCSCGMKAYESLADLALGPAAGLVVENVPCFVCTSCNHLQFPDNGRALRDQIARWAQDPHRSHKTEPSLRYLSDAHPRNLQIEVSTRCNLFCAYCSHKALKAQTNMDALTFDKVMNAVDFNEIDYVDITGLGEATMNEDLPKIIEHIKQRAPHAEIGLVSNAVSASVGKWERLIEAGLTSISFSIDTLDAERFSHQRGGGSLKKAMRTVEGVAKLRSTLKRRLALRLKAVLIDEPYADAEALQDWSLRIGLDKPQFSTLDLRESAMKNYCGTDIERKAIDSAFDGSAFEQKLDQRWRRLGGLAPEKIMPGRYRHPALRIDKSLCHWAINAAFVTVDGDLLSCCESMTDLPRSIMGSLRNQQMTDAWREDLFWSYRLPLSLGMLPSGCVGCGYAPTYGQPM